MMTSASSSLPSAKRRPRGVKRSIVLSFLSLILPSTIFWLVPTSGDPRVAINTHTVSRPLVKPRARGGMRTDVVPATGLYQGPEDTLVHVALVRAEAHLREAFEGIPNAASEFSTTTLEETIAHLSKSAKCKTERAPSSPCIGYGKEAPSRSATSVGGPPSS